MQAHIIGRGFDQGLEIIEEDLMENSQFLIDQQSSPTNSHIFQHSNNKPIANNILDKDLLDGVEHIQLSNFNLDELEMETLHIENLTQKRESSFRQYKQSFKSVMKKGIRTKVPEQSDLTLKNMSSDLAVNEQEAQQLVCKQPKKVFLSMENYMSPPPMSPPHLTPPPEQTYDEVKNKENLLINQNYPYVYRCLSPMRAVASNPLTHINPNNQLKFREVELKSIPETEKQTPKWVDMSVNERNEKWLTQKQQNLQKLKEQAEVKEKAQCSFKPKMKPEINTHKQERIAIESCQANDSKIDKNFHQQIKQINGYGKLHQFKKDKGFKDK